MEVNILEKELNKMAESYTYKNESSLLPDGDYEARIDTIGIKVLPSGKEKLTIMYRLRDDIDGQPYGNKCIFEDIWKEKESPEHFNRKRINQLLGTQELKDGTVFNSIHEIMEFLKENNCLVLHIIKIFDEYYGEDVNKVSYYKSSKFKPQVLGKDVQSNVVNDDELPF